MKTRSDETIAWLALYMIPGLGNSVYKNLLEHFGDPERVLRASLRELVEVKGVREDIARKIMAKEFSSDPLRELKKVEQCGARIVTFNDPEYPTLLREIAHPPMILYVKGTHIPLSQSFIAVVGSRHATHYGLSAAEKIGSGLASRGVGVVSGLARGIDSAAHEGSLTGGGITIAVMGTGIDRVYPVENKKLYRRVVEKGAVLSEFPVGTPPEPKNFPIRNRIISGLSRGVVVVEATLQSGSLITASLALEQGREVFAVPGSIDSFKSTGAHFLIKQGAKLVENADDILEEFEYFARIGPNKDELTDIPSRAPYMDETETKVYEIIGHYPMHIDEIARHGEMSASAVSSVLMKLELKGIIKQLPGKIFVR
jgi:DNA processing protein